MTITKDDALNALQKARKVQHLMKDERSIRALDVAERYIRGEASREELEKAKDEARNAYDAVAVAVDADAVDADATNKHIDKLLEMFMKGKNVDGKDS